MARALRYCLRREAGDREPRRLKRECKLARKARRIVAVRGLRYAANGYRTRP